LEGSRSHSVVEGGGSRGGNNNRPVSPLPAASKVLERVALNQLTEYMDREKCLSHHESGNKKLHSTETLNMMLDAMDKKEVTTLVLLDLSKAFNSLDLSLLLAKLSGLGVSKFSLDWFKRYLSERTQFVRVESPVPEARMTVHAVLRGSLLGPALFNTYIDELSCVPQMYLLESYVDDSQLYLSLSALRMLMTPLPT